MFFKNKNDYTNPVILYEPKFNLEESIEIMKKYGMTEEEPVIDTHEVEVSYAGYCGKMAYNVARQMMKEIWKINDMAAFIIDGVLEQCPPFMRTSNKEK